MIRKTKKFYENGITTNVDVITAEGDGFFLTMTVEEGDVNLTPHGMRFLNDESAKRFTEFVEENFATFECCMVTYGTIVLLESFLNEAVKFIENETDYELELRGQKIYNLKTTKTP